MNSTPDNYDFAILGGGAAGLSLALALVRSPLGGKSILIVEKDAKDSNDRTLCFWTNKPSPFDGIAHHVWPRLRFLSPTLDRTSSLFPFRYVMLRSLDFYDHARAVLREHNVTFVRGSAEVTDGSDHVQITIHTPTCNVITCNAFYAFDSRIRPEDMLPNPRRFNTLKQHFTGWEIETEAPIFDPQTVTMFDLCTPQRGGVTFFYTLPISERHALVEYTLFSPELLPAGEYEAALRTHLSEVGAGEYRILAAERGVIPMTDQPFPRRLGKRILSIGTRGGRVKPSTGYAFSRIQRDSEKVVASLLRHGHPFSIPPDKLRHRLEDTIILDVLAREPDLGRPILSAVFARNPIQRVLRFLDDSTAWWEDLPILASHVPGPFVQAIARKSRSILKK